MVIPSTLTLHTTLLHALLDGQGAENAVWLAHERIGSV